LKRRNPINFSRRFRRALDDYHRGVTDCAALNASWQSWSAHAAHGKTQALRRAVLAHLRRRFAVVVADKRKANA
jgi:hypothetical protein